MKLHRIFLLATIACVGLTLSAGTIVYRPNKDAEPRRISNVKIISIENKIMTIEVDGGRERLSLSQVEGYYDTDIKNAADGFDDNSPEYTVSVRPIKAPNRAQRKSGDKMVNETFDIEYSIQPVPNKDEKRDTDSVKYPYVYVYIMTEYSEDGSGQRPIYLTSWPKAANVSKKSYDKAAIMEKVLSSKRANLYKYQGTSSNRLMSTSWDRKDELPLTMIKNKNAKILAWHVEIWGKTDIVYQEDWVETGVRVGKNWWQRL